MRLLILPRYGAMGASSRLRMMQYVPALKDAGFEVEVSSLLGDDYLRDLYAGTVSVPQVARSYWRRFRRVWSIRDFDMVWLEKEVWPWLPAWLELLLLGRSTRLVVDYDDAIFHRYDSHPSALVRGLLGGKIDAVMRRAELVTAGNDYLAQRVRDAGDTRVEWLPTVIDLDRYPLPAPTCETSNESVVVGWIGSPSTAGYLHEVSAALAPLQAAGTIRCVAIGARPDQVVGTPFEAREWHEDTEVSELLRFDIGIMPLPDEPWEQGKCGYKLIQYMACSLPVIASSVGVNAVIVVSGQNGFLVSSLNQWTDAVELLAESRKLRRSLGQEGRRMVEQVYCIQAQANRLIGMLHSVKNGMAHV